MTACKTVTLLAILLFLLLIPQCASACTGVYIGKDVSADGTTIIAQSSDGYTNLTSCCVAKERVVNSPGRIYTGSNGFIWPLPETTAKYNALLSKSDVIDDHWGTSVINEYGVTVSATVTTHPNREVLALDPLMPDGTGEEHYAILIAESVKTAREGVALLTSILDEKGTSESNSLIIADKNEAWYVETYTGHQYAAVRLPEDKVAVYGNQFMIETLDEFDEVITSPGLYETAEKSGRAVYTDGKLNIYYTFAADDAASINNSLRTWEGHLLLAPSSSTKEYKEGVKYPFLYSPDKKVSLQDVFSIYRQRGDAAGIHYISIEACLNVHVIQIFDTLPDEMCCVCWLTHSSAAFAPFSPVSNLAAGCSEMYANTEVITGYNDKSAYYHFKRLNILAGQNTSRYSGVQTYFAFVEDTLVKTYRKILENTCRLYAADKAAAIAYITECETAIQEELLKDADRLFDDVMWDMISISDTVYLTPEYISPFEAYVDVESVAGLYGWNVTKEDPVLTLEKEGHTWTIQADKYEVIAIDDTDTIRINKNPGTLAVNGEKTGIVPYQKNGRYYLPLSQAEKLCTGDIVLFGAADAKTQKDAAKSPLPFAGTAAGIGLLSLVIFRRH